MKIKIAVIGLGNVGRRLLELMGRKRVLMQRRFDLEFMIVAAADSSGALLAESIEPEELISLKAQRKNLASRYNLVDAMKAIELADADLIVELSPTNLKTGAPGLDLIRRALDRGINVVTANKGPLVLAYSELMESARKHGVKLLHSATVTGGLPTLNIGSRDLGASEITGFEGIVNATTNYILARMSEGESFDVALKHAQDVGHAEADPSLDVDGWDAATKLVIIANAVLGRQTRLEEVDVSGIRNVTMKDLHEARAAGQVVKLVARAERVENGEGNYQFSVKPTQLRADHPLAHVNADMMGVIYHTDINGAIFASIEERDPYPTAAAVLRDMINVYR